MTISLFRFYTVEHPHLEKITLNSWKTSNKNSLNVSPLYGSPLKTQYLSIFVNKFERLVVKNS